MLAGLALVAPAGCGGGGPSDQDEINKVLTTSFTTADPAQCDEVTGKGLQQLAPSVADSPDPAKACREALDPSSNADSIQVADLTVNGDRASATVTPRGGSFAGAVVTVALANQDGWKIDGLEEVKIVDRNAFLASLDEATARSFGSDALTPRNARCIAGYIRRNVANTELERSITAAQKGYVFDAVRLCLGGGLDFIAITQLIENQLLHAGIDSDKAKCLAGLSIAGQKSATLEEFANSERIKRSIEKVLKKGAFLCTPA
jgi:hypothetical protein